LVDVHHPDAERITLVMDNLNTHTPASLYKAFAPAEARRLLERLVLRFINDVRVRLPLRNGWAGILPGTVRGL
jgi:hypothetical protein